MEIKVFSRRILPVKFQEPVYYQFSSKNFKRKRPKNGPFLRIFLGILPVKFQNNKCKLSISIAKKGNRTLDLHFTRVSLYQLSYFGTELEYQNKVYYAIGFLIYFNSPLVAQITIAPTRKDKRHHRMAMPLGRPGNT